MLSLKSWSDDDNIIASKLCVCVRVCVYGLNLNMSTFRSFKTITMKAIYFDTLLFSTVSQIIQAAHSTFKC